MKVLIFDVADRSYALPADLVREVEQPMPVTPLPFVPDYVEGLTASGGRVLPQIDLARRLGRAAPGEAPGELLVVCAPAGDIVLRIGRARRMADVPDSELTAVGDGPAEETSPAGTMAAAEFLWDDRPVLLLRADALGIEGVSPAAPAAGAEGPTALLGDLGSGPMVERRGIGTAVMVVEAGGESYAFPLESVSEVYADPALTPIPNTPDIVAGISVLRGSPRLVVSLARLLGLPADPNESAMVAAIAAGRPLVFQCTRLVGIRRYADTARESAGDRTGCVDSYLIDGDGTVTGLLALDGLVPQDRGERLDALLPRAKEMENDRRHAANDVRRMLLIGTGPHTCAIDIGRVDRIAGFSPMVETPDDGGPAVGMTDIGGAVLPVADLGAAFGSPSTVAATAYVVVRTSRADGFGLWALPVERLERLADVPVASIRGGNAATGLIAGVGRVGERLITILDVDGLESLAPAAPPQEMVA